MTPTRSTEEPSTAQRPFMTDTMTPPMGVLGGHVLEHLCSCVVGKCPEQPFTNLGVRMRDRSRSALRTGRVEHLGGGVEIQSSN